jgi:hypothetical protein
MIYYRTCASWEVITHHFVPTYAQNIQEKDFSSFTSELLSLQTIFLEVGYTNQPSFSLSKTIQNYMCTRSFFFNLKLQIS